MIWFVPVTGLAGASSLITTDRVLASLLIALLVGTVMSVPLPALQARVVKTASARRISESVWTAAAAAAVLALLELDGRSLVSAAVGLVCLWAALAISVALRPLAVAPAGLRTERLQWLPIPRRSPVAVAGKRAFDAVVSAIALLAIAPVLAVVAIAIKAHDGGPVLFKQRRVGQNGVPFEMLKFRSMVLNAEELRAELEAESDRNGPLFKMTNDPRITPVGRIIRELSIDELPQLVNIVRGDMSLVGPRPALPDEEAQFDNTLQRRNLVTPGLTGLWQAEARSDADFERFRELDLRYVSAASPSLDLWIILATATDVFLAVAALPLGLFGVELVKNDGIDLTDQASDSVIDLRSADGSPSPRPSAA